ncbi:MAG: alpha-ketoglutarate-dependent taurine dioxygenase [Acidimicrobiales bacterium]|jgi:alpha-ketoglutarate-dependent taurine dioxygenase
MGTTTTFKLEPLENTSFGAVVTGVDVRTVDDGLVNDLKQAWLQYALLIFPAQHLTTEEQNTFARHFGDLEFEAAPISNIGADGKLHHLPDDDRVKSLKGNEGWHLDSTYMPAQAKGAVFTAEIVPESGAPTGWADMRAAYDALDEATKTKIADLSAYHSLYYSQGRAGYLPKQRNDDGSYNLYGYHDFEVSLRPLVKVHPETGRKSLVIGRHAHNIVGMDSDDSVALLDRLDQDACQPPRIYHHDWNPGDAVLWDNRCLMHRGVPFDMTQPRRMWHARIAGEATELATNHPVALTANHPSKAGE